MPVRGGIKTPNCHFRRMNCPNSGMNYLAESRNAICIQMQRRTLGEATRDLHILEDALQATERRLKKRIDAGSINNLSAAEFHLLQQNRAELTSGKMHLFDYSFFEINELDKLALRLGIYLKEMTAQYFNLVLHRPPFIIYIKKRVPPE